MLGASGFSVVDAIPRSLLGRWATGRRENSNPRRNFSDSSVAFCSPHLQLAPCGLPLRPSSRPTPAPPLPWLPLRWRRLRRWRPLAPWRRSTRCVASSARAGAERPRWAVCSEPGSLAPADCALWSCRPIAVAALLGFGRQAGRGACIHLSAAHPPRPSQTPYTPISELEKLGIAKMVCLGAAGWEDAGSWLRPGRRAHDTNPHAPDPPPMRRTSPSSRRLACTRCRASSTRPWCVCERARVGGGRECLPRPL